MSRDNQEQIVEWVLNHPKAIALFIEPIGKDEYLDEGRLKANKKAYYDNLFKAKGLKTIKEGRFIWNDVDTEFEHYTSTNKLY